MKQTDTSPNARVIALEALIAIEEKQAYSNLILHQLIQRYTPSRAETALTTELVYGTVQRMNTIDYYLKQLLNKNNNKLESWVRQLLRMSFYQLHYLDKIPAHAAVNEAVLIAKHRGHKGIVSLVNGVLRSAIRRKEEWAIPHSMPTTQAIALEYSHPEWMVKRWMKRYGEQTTRSICQSNNTSPHVSVRVNERKQSRNSLLDRLQSEGFNAHPSPLSPSGIILKNAGNMALSPMYLEGEISIQDESSMLVAPIVDAKPNMKVLDCCAAPGGKTTHLAERMDDKGELWAGDLHPHKLKLIDAQVKRLKLTCIHTFVDDARHLSQRFAPATFDRVLLDAPCSGFGVIRRKPDLKWRKKADDIRPLPDLQLELLNQVSTLVKPGGLLIYSTCTIESMENEEVIKTFLEANAAFEVDPQFAQKLPSNVSAERIQGSSVTILPHDFGSDGFFIASLIRTC